MKQTIKLGTRTFHQCHKAMKKKNEGFQKTSDIYCRTKRGSQETTMEGIGSHQAGKNKINSTYISGSFGSLYPDRGQLPWTSHGGILCVPLGVSTVMPHYWRKARFLVPLALLCGVNHRQFIKEAIKAYLQQTTDDAHGFCLSPESLPH